ncbi:acyl-CoA dehydrogenase C-terminal domain-containing protein, partial [Nocardia amamiensis]|uniref:acyl-CoA dehydrogenase C-terminal domain-containing protein n=1 Tax=Nocardia amamiensis TaxID=404578 RepID=UPI000A41FF8A
IQAQDFFFRKIARDRGVALGHVNGQIAAFLDTKTGRFGTERELLATALEDVQAMAATLTGYLMAAQQTPAELYKVGLGSVRFLLAVGDLLIGWRLLVHAEIAAAALAADAPEKDRAFYTGKVAMASFFAKNVLPSLTAVKGIIAALDNDIMELDETAF